MRPFYSHARHVRAHAPASLVAQEVVLDDNDGVLYYGPDIVHWRSPQPDSLTQIVFAFREEDEAHCNNQ